MRANPMTSSGGGLLMVISGPSGAGKSTVIRTLLETGLMKEPPFFSVSATTRAPRAGEREGVHYHFIGRDQFQALIDSDGLLEYAEYAGHLYGTPRAPVEEHLLQNRCVLLDIDVQGALQIRRCRPDAVLVFLLPPSWEELERRLRERKSELEDKIRRRLAIAHREFTNIRLYDYVIFNHSVEAAAEELSVIIRAELCRVTRKLPVFEGGVTHAGTVFEPTDGEY